MFPEEIAIATCSSPRSERISPPRFGPGPSGVTSWDIPVTSRSAFIASSEAGQVEAALFRDRDGFFVAGIGVPHDAQSGVVAQAQAQPLFGFVAAVGDGHQAGMLAVTHADAA